MISVTSVKVTKDLRYAKVYVSIFANSEEEKKSNLDALKSAAGFVRREIAQRINLRHNPQIIFEIDDSIDYGMHIDSLIEKPQIIFEIDDSIDYGMHIDSLIEKIKDK